MNFLVYLLKVMLVSGILFGYYRLFLRNRSFHHYNRFYLLAALLLSVVLPFVRVPVPYAPENTVQDVVYQAADVLSVNYGEDDLLTAPATGPATSVLTWMNGIYLLHAAGALLLLCFIGRSLLYIHKLWTRYPAEPIAALKFYNTGEPGTPFSFFRSVFWNRQLPFNSSEGQQVFRHELFHVQHHHSADRLAAEIITALFWMNPFFHLIKKELRAIHEFLADQFAISRSNRYEYASLLVQQALHARQQPLAHHFFQNHIKRRIAMITQLKNSRYGYWSRLMVLPVCALLFAGIALYAKKPVAPPIHENPAVNAPLTVVLDAGHGGSDAGAKSYDGRYLEKDLALQISQKIQELAPRYNIKVVMTREGDHLPGSMDNKNEALQHRIALIEKEQADIFLSLHISYAPPKKQGDADRPEYSGFEAYITNRNQAIMKDSRNLGTHLLQSLSGLYSTRQTLLQRKDQGIWVLDQATCPAVLLECGYLSNSKDLALISDPEGQEKIAQHILEGISGYQNRRQQTGMVTDTVPVTSGNEQELKRKQETLKQKKEANAQKVIANKARVRAVRTLEQERAQQNAQKRMRLKVIEQANNAKMRQQQDIEILQKKMREQQVANKYMYEKLRQQKEQLRKLEAVQQQNKPAVTDTVPPKTKDKSHKSGKKATKYKLELSNQKARFKKDRLTNSQRLAFQRRKQQYEIKKTRMMLEMKQKKQEIKRKQLKDQQKKDDRLNYYNPSAEEAEYYVADFSNTGR